MLHVQDLSFFALDEPTAVFDRLSLKVEEGSFIYIVGGNRSGKSTLCKLMAGIHERDLGGRCSGVIAIDGVPIRSWTSRSLAAVRGVVLSDATAMFCNLTVEQELAFTPENLLWSRESVINSVIETLGLIGINEPRDARVDRLSQGQAQRLAWGCALSASPKLLLLDEPFVNVSPDGRVRLLELLDAHCRMGLSVIIFSTELLADELPDSARYALLYGGELTQPATYRVFVEQCREQLECSAVILPPLIQLLFSAEMAGSDSDELVSALHELSSSAGRSEEHIKPSEWLRIAGLRFSYPRDSRGQLTIDAAIPLEGITAIVGENGAGKSTLAKCLAGVVRPQAGLVSVGSNMLTNLKPSELLRWIWYVPDRPDAQFLRESVASELSSIAGACTQEFDEVVTSAFSLMGLADKHPHSLSLAQQRNLSLALAYCIGSRLVIIDEPTAGLDRHGMRDFVRTLTFLQQSGRAIMLITHDMNLVIETADRVVALSTGTVAYSGSTESFFNNPDIVRACGLVVPPLFSLLHRLRIPRPMAGLLRSRRDTQNDPEAE